MIINTLNSHKKNNEFTKKNIFSKKISSLPTLLIFLLPTFGFYLIQNNNLNYPYMYESVGYKFSVFITIIATGLSVIYSRKMMKSKIVSFIILIAILVYCFISAFLADGGFRYLGIAINTVCVSIVVRYGYISQSQVKWILRILCISVVLCVLNCINGYYNNKQFEHIVNTNILAFFGLSSIIYGHWCINYIDNKCSILKQLLKVFFIVCSFYIIWKCQSRGSLLAWTFFMVAVYILPMKLFTNKKLVICMVLGIIIVGIGFSYYYVSNYTLLEHMDILGKRLTTRGRIWTYFWNEIMHSGIYGWIGFGTHGEMRDIFDYGAHNVYLCIWYDVGFIGLVLFMFYVVRCVKELFNYNNPNTSQLFALIGFMSYMIYDYFGDQFAGPLAVWSYVMLGLMHQNIIVNNSKSYSFRLKT